MSLLLVACGTGNEQVNMGDLSSVASVGASDMTVVAGNDLTMPADLLGPPDSSSPIDLSVLPDLTTLTDLSSLQDLSDRADLSVVPDLTVRADLSVLADLTAPVDQATLPDLTARLGGQVAFQSPVGNPYAACKKPHAIGTADFNGDGKPDVATACIGSNNVAVLLNNGDGSFATAVTYPIDRWPLSLTIGDFNGDRTPDIVVANNKPGTNPSTFSVLLGTGRGTFNAAANYPSGGDGANAITSADFDGDGKLDLVVSDFGTIVTQTVLFTGVGNGTFVQGSVLAGLYGQDLATGDFNSDLFQDLVLINDAGLVVVVPGDGKGGFGNSTSYQAGMAGGSIKIADLDRNGALDIVATLYTDQTVGVLLGNRGMRLAGDGTFRQAGAFRVGGLGPNGLVVADFDRDGLLDVTTVDTAAADVSVLTGDGQGSLKVLVDAPVGAVPTGIATADFNGDGKPDLAVANQTDGTVSILLTR